MFDAQTSGGLLLAVNPAQLDQALTMLEAAGDTAIPVGRARTVGAGEPPLSIL
jgi:selenide,water dikinase